MANQHGVTRTAIVAAYVKQGFSQKEAESHAGFVLDIISDLAVSEYTIDALANGEVSTCDGYCHEFCGE